MRIIIRIKRIMKFPITISVIINIWLHENYATADQCGKPLGSSKLEGKIIGGYEVGYYKYPWFATLLLEDSPFCAGALIGPNTIVTVAHCFRRYLSTPNTNLNDIYKVKLGVNNWCVNETSQKEFKVNKVIVHEKYLSNDPYNDIAIMKISGNTKDYEPACLPVTELGDKTRGRDGLIIGLGTTKSGSSSAYPCSLREARVLIYSDKDCKDMLENANADAPDLAIFNAFCAGYISGGIDACQGDSGGPLMVLGPEGRYAVLGVTSFGYECALKDRLGVYTDVSHYLEWIREKAGIESQLKSTTQSVSTRTTAKHTSSPGHQNQNYPVVNEQHVGVYPPEVLIKGNPANLLKPSRIIIEFKKHPKRKGHRKGNKQQKTK